MVRFDLPCVSTAHALDYFSMHMAHDDYLTEQGQAEMVWVGNDAARLGLSGQVQKQDFQRLCEGWHPQTGERLGMRDKGPIRRVCYFGQISPPKDVSIASLIGQDQRIESWWKEAVKATIQEMEAVTAVRIRKGGIEDKDRSTGGMVAAIVTHEASRALDPQLHTHICIMNVAYDPVEKQWKGVQPNGFYKYQSYFREVCYSKLAERMTEHGYEIEKVRGIGFNIKGFPENVRHQFSKRREEIEEEAARVGAKSQDQLQAITARTRKAKIKADGQALRTQWKQEIGDDLATIKTIIDQAQGVRRTKDDLPPQQAMHLAEAQLFERHSVVNERVLLREALIYGRGDVSLADLKSTLEQRIHKGDLIRKAETIISQATLAMEREYLEGAMTNKRSYRDLGQVSDLDRSLSAEQKEAVKTILFNQDQIVILQGKAGTGKTRTLKEIVQGIQKAGHEVFACAPSSGATEVLRHELTPHANTLQQLLINQNLQKQVAGKVILVDEAGLISSRQMRDLYRLVNQNNNRLILVGDIGQHSSVEAGDALRALQTYGGVTTARLTQIRRQRDPAFRKAISLLADKKAYAAFTEFQRLGSIKEIADEKQLLQEAAVDYLTTIQQKKSCLVIAPVWSDIHRFHAELRPKLKDHGLLQNKEITITTYHSLQWTEADRQQARNYQKEDVLVFHQDHGSFRKGEHLQVEERHGHQLIVKNQHDEKLIFDPQQAKGFDVGLARPLSVAVGEKLLIRANLKSQSLCNGQIVQVSKIEEDGTLHLTHGKIIPPEFRHFSYGYATTSHAAQGKTIDRGIVLMTGEGMRAANLRQAYVSHSRFQESHTTYTINQKAAIDAMANPAERLLVLEVIQDRLRRWKIFQKLTDQAEAWVERRKVARAQTLKPEPQIKKGMDVSI